MSREEEREEVISVGDGETDGGEYEEGAYTPNSEDSISDVFDEGEEVKEKKREPEEKSPILAGVLKGWLNQICDIVLDIREQFNEFNKLTNRTRGVLREGGEYEEERDDDKEIHES